MSAFSIPLEEWAGMMLPTHAEHRVLAMLYGYFDESGTHDASTKTAIAGFIGTVSDWLVVQYCWREVLGERTFHYAKMRGNNNRGNKDWDGVPEQERKDTILSCADILGNSRLRVVGGAFEGQWKRAISQGSDWSMRFPKPYHLCFEMCMNEIERLSVEKWNGEPVALLFADHEEFGPRAEEVWRTFRGNGHWPHIHTFAYASTVGIPGLQAADMVVYETYQNLGRPSIADWADWPLMERLMGNGADVAGFIMNEERLVAMMKRADAEPRKFLKTVPPTDPKT